MLRGLFLSVLALCAAQAAPFPAELQAQERMCGVQLSPRATVEDVEQFKSILGGGVVRYQLHWDDFDAADEATHETYFAWLTEALDRFDLILPTLAAQNIKVALNLHTPPGAFARRDNRATHRLFVDAWTQSAFVEAWQMIATRYTGNSAIWAYDLLNEPAQWSNSTAPLKDWNTLAAEAAEAIRVIDPSRPIMMTPRYGDIRRIKSMTPLDIDNVIYTFHFYQPHRFLHQGLYGIKPGLRYPDKKKKWNKKFLQKELKGAIAFQKKNNAQIFIGEFSTTSFASAKDGEKYLRDLLPIFAKQGWSWAYHSWRESEPWDLEVGSPGRLNIIKQFIESCQDS